MNRFSTIIAVFAAIVLYSLPCFADDQTPSPASQGLSIVVQSSQQTYAAGDDVNIDVIIRNSSATDALIGGSAFDLSSFRFVVLDPSSHTLIPTSFARKLLGIPTKVKKNTPVTIGAGWQRRYQFELSKMYPMTTPGMYSITVKRVVVVKTTNAQGKPASQVVLLASDPVALTITGPSSTPDQTSTSTATSTQAGAHAPRWTIAFVREGDIWEADGQGNNQRLVIHNGEAPSWSPDKSMLAFARKGNVWVSDPDGQNQRQLTDSEALEAGVNPVFSPDGKWIVYRSWSQRTGIMLRVVSLDGKVDKELLQDGEDPAW